jgi:hypothetical protein
LPKQVLLLKYGKVSQTFNEAMEILVEQMAWWGISVALPVVHI